MKVAILIQVSESNIFEDNTKVFNVDSEEGMTKAVEAFSVTQHEV